MSKSYRKNPEGKSRKRFPDGYKRKQRHNDHQTLKKLTRQGSSDVIEIDEEDFSTLEDEHEMISIYKKENE